jgi:hypothetical protein
MYFSKERKRTIEKWQPILMELLQQNSRLLNFMLGRQIIQAWRERPSHFSDLSAPPDGFGSSSLTFAWSRSISRRAETMLAPQERLPLISCMSLALIASISGGVCGAAGGLVSAAGSGGLF